MGPASGASTPRSHHRIDCPPPSLSPRSLIHPLSPSLSVSCVSLSPPRSLFRFPPERGWPANGSVGPALRLLEQLQRRHPNVSLADLVALSAVVAIHDLRGPAIPFQLGRADLPPHPLPLSTPSRIPIGNSSLPTLLRTFRALGLSAQEMVALIGAHSLGRCHVERSGYEGRWSRRPGVFSADVFRAMRGERWSRRQWAGPMQWQNEDGALMMLPSDLALMEGEETRSWVLKYADDEPLFFTHFQAAFTKLIELGVQRHRTHAGGGG